MKFIVGLTGGIGCGKSTVSSIFNEFGVDIIDTDHIAHEITRAHMPATVKIGEVLGGELIKFNGELDRPALRRRVFSDKSEKEKLESILHPMIRAEVERKIPACSSAYIIIVIPLLIETESYGDIIDRTLVVDCEEKTQVRRAMARSFLSEAEVLSIMQNQVDRKIRLESADDILENEGTMDDLRRKARIFHRKYLEFSL